MILNNRFSNALPAPCKDEIISLEHDSQIDAPQLAFLELQIPRYLFSK
jgi:hypothetical protein